jgi:hypothetical protein
MPTCSLKKARAERSISFGSLVALGLASAFLLASAAGANAQTSNNGDTTTPQTVSPVIIQSSPGNNNDNNYNSNPDNIHVSSPANKISYGIRVGTYMPTDSKTKNEFGDNWLSLGFFMTKLGEDYDKGRLGLDLRFISRSDNNNSIFMMPVGIDYRKSFNKDETGHEHAIRPYVGVTADVLPVWMQDPNLGISYGSTVTEAGSVFVGAKTGRIYLEARYQASGKVHDLGMSGLELTGGISF